MGGKVWFGTEKDMGWVPAPLTGASLQNVFWRASGVFLNGGGFQRQSHVHHKEMSLSWAVQNLADLDAVIRAFNSGERMYYLDPVTAQYNAVPPYWAQYQDEAPDLFPTLTESNPITGTNTLGYSTKTRQYTVNKAVSSQLKLVVPTGYKLYFGVHGARTGTAEFVLNSAACTPLTTTDSTRTNVVLNGGQTYTFGVRGEGTVTINGLIGAIRPDTDPALGSGGFITGHGTTGLALKGEPQLTEYSAGIPNAQIGLSADLIEVGAWEYN